MSHARIVDIRSAADGPARKSHAWQVLREAARVEPDEGRRIAWYRNDPIERLGLQTAEVLVASGRYEEVLAFLRGVKVDLGLEMPAGFGAF
ncbi:MAG TPA: hypothetical protein VM621_12295 [Luteibacter sp.]|uniref:hypothetical protein n=1 Tax=Luteibacter sp. TaxID=1886636 RepID=UPI002CBF18F3|nr:hypothetical protein [Luteibacter sp.]HVI55814.1 hypothetical protein [Luteibacter sp.]